MNVARKTAQCFPCPGIFPVVRATKDQVAAKEYKLRIKKGNLGENLPDNSERWGMLVFLGRRHQ